MRRCRECVAAAEAEVQSSAAAREDGEDAEPVSCTSCQRAQPAAAFSRTQLQKLAKGGSARCLECVAAALAPG